MLLCTKVDKETQTTTESLRCGLGSSQPIATSQLRCGAGVHINLDAKQQIKTFTWTQSQARKKPLHAT